MVASVATVASVGPVGGSDVTPVIMGTVPVVGTHVSAVVPEKAKQCVNHTKHCTEKSHEAPYQCPIGPCQTL